ncbi:M12 family metallopeptidase [Longimicrobium sp.]|uniref:M12 family metallopeptidase n=1 Tax=Longimicrobium sp. TaxID=2029185 RepID=UPI002E37271C|nr:M12 family metallopeptidase [Longimicrobium sp.]HEX6042144.1 M12 family metallopeptidase [Longimicrobium sp.]
MQEKHRIQGRTLKGVQRIAAGALLVLAAACADEPTSPAGPRAPDGATGGRYQVGYVIGANGRPEQILFEDVRGDAVVEGDVVIGLAADVPRTPEAALAAGPDANSRLSIAITDTNKYWPTGVVPYRFKYNTTSTTQANALAAMERINRRIDGITFVVATDTTMPHILILDDNNTSGSCRAEVGRDLNSPTNVNINGCGAGTSSHEIMHALGFHHEQKRCDRDDYIEITDTLAADGGWTRRCTSSTYAGTAYDLLSIMHYDPEPGFIGAKVDLWLSFEGVDASRRIGQRDSLSSCDNRALDSIYPSTGTPVCDRPYTTFATYHSQSGYWGSERGFILDEEEPAFTRNDPWSYSSGAANPDYDNRHYYTTSTSDKGWYTFDVPADTAYNVYAWAFQKSGVTQGTAVYKLYAGTPAGITGTSVPIRTWEWNQTQGLRWLFLGDASLTAGTYTLQIQKKSGTTGTIIADAVRITPDHNDPLN